MNFTESNTVEQMILDVVTARGARGLREMPAGWKDSLGRELLPAALGLCRGEGGARQPGDVMVEPWLRLARGIRTGTRPAGAACLAKGGRRLEA
jgi:hypothetical protein